MSFHYPIGGGSGGGGVTSLNTLTGALNILSGDGIDINTSGSDITISALGASVDNTTLEVKVATTAALPGTPTYDNGAAGVGATLTRSSNGTTGTIDGITAANLMAGDRILVKNQSAQLQNGIYEVTQQGSASLPYILTRTADADTTAEMDDMVVVASSGTTNKGVPFGQQTNNPTIGTNNIVFTATGIYVKQRSSGTQAAGQIPYYASAAMTITKGDSLFFRDIASKVTLIGTDIELVEPTITSTGALFTGVFAESFIGSGAVVAENTDDTNIAYSVAIIGDDGKPNGGILGGVRETGAFIGAMEAGQHDSVYDKPYVGYTAQIAGQGGGLDYRNVLMSDAAGTRIKSDNLFVLDASRGEIRLRTTSGSTDWWEIPVVAGPDGYVLTAHGDGAEATWEPGGGSPAGSNTWIQYNNAGAFGASSDFIFDQATSTFTATNNWEVFRTTIKFDSGGGTDDLTASAATAFTGTPPTTFVVLAFGNIQIVNYINLVGGNFNQGDTITGSVSGAEGYVAYDDGVGQLYVSITNSIQFATGDVIDNANGVTADYDTSTTSDDIFFWYSTAGGGGPTVMTGASQVLDDGISITFGSVTGHGAGDSWEWSYKTLKNTVLSNRKIGSGIFGGAINGSYFMSGSGSSTIQAINGFFQNGDDDRIFPLSAYEDLTSGNNADKERAYYGFNPFKNQPTEPLEYIVYMRKGVGIGPFTTDITEFKVNTVEGFRLETNKSILMSSPLFNVSDNTFSWIGGTNGNGITIDDTNSTATLGNLSGGNNTKITIDDVNEQITISNLPAYDDDTAAGTAGLTAGMLYMTTGSGAAPLNVAGILMIKQ